MGHPMEDYYLDESMARGRRQARFEKVLEALKDVLLADFTVGQLSDIYRLVTHEWGEPTLLERLENLVTERHRRFEHGMFVRYKKPKKGQRGRGIVTSYPRRGTRLVYVQGPRGWAGWASVDELEVVEP